MTRLQNYDEFINFLNDKYSDHDVKYSDYVEFDQFYEDYNADDLMYKIEDERGFDEDIIYYSNAMRLLSEHDPSLHKSMELADSYGYTLRDCSSEILASILASQINRENFPKEDIQDFLDSLEWDEESDEE